MKDISLESPSYPGELRGIILARRLGGESLRYSNRLRAEGRAYRVGSTILELVHLQVTFFFTVLPDFFFVHARFVSKQTSQTRVKFGKNMKGSFTQQTQSIAVFNQWSVTSTALKYARKRLGSNQIPNAFIAKLLRRTGFLVKWLW